MDSPAVSRMQDDWNRRAREDAHYFVAFGRRNQDDEEFFASGAEQARGLEVELRRLAPGNPRSRRALEIGCGPGRLMRPMSRHFGEIHGVDVSDEMARLAREKLAGIRHAHVHHAPDSTLAAFADDSFDFVYSYAVFQHIPSRDVVFGYLREGRRVLKPGGVLRCQINGLPPSARTYDTWAGVRIGAEEVREFAREQGLELLALEGVETQYMWATLRRPVGESPAVSDATRIRRVTSAHSSQPVVPVRGRFAAISVWVEGLPPGCDLNGLEVRVEGRAGFATYIGPAEADGMRQVNALLPAGLGTGLAGVELWFYGRLLCPRATVRLTSPGPAVPRLVSLTDGIDLMSGTRIVTGSVKATIEEVEDPGEAMWMAQGWIGGKALVEREVFRTDPRVPTWEVNWRVPEGVAAGDAEVLVRVGKRELGRIPVNVAVDSRPLSG